MKYRQARKKSTFLVDDHRATGFADWEPVTLTGFGFSVVGLLGWLPGCVVSLLLELAGLYRCRRTKLCGQRVAVCGMIFSLLGCFMSLGSGAWRRVGERFADALFAWALLSLAAALLVFLAVFAYYKLRKPDRKN